jgi:hypothetical protein
MGGMPWSDIETAMLKAALERHAMRLHEVAALFPHRTRDAIYRHIYRSGLQSLHPPGMPPKSTRRG